MKKINKNISLESKYNIRDIKYGLNKAFTLVELIVVIAILTILAISSANFNFNKMSNNEKLKIFNNKIITNIETIRNNSLMGRGIGIDLINPKSWRIDFSKIGSGKMLVSYHTGSLDISFPEKNIVFTGGYYINTIKFVDILGTNINSINLNSSGTGTIFIYQDHISGSSSFLTSSENKRLKQIELITGYRGFTGSILINTISGLVEKN